MTPASMFRAFITASAAWCLAAFLLGPRPETEPTQLHVLHNIKIIITKLIESHRALKAVSHFYWLK